MKIFTSYVEETEAEIEVVKGSPDSADAGVLKEKSRAEEN